MNVIRPSSRWIGWAAPALALAVAAIMPLALSVPQVDWMRIEQRNTDVQAEIDDELQDLASTTEEEFDLERGCLIVARLEYPELDTGGVGEELGELLGEGWHALGLRAENRSITAAGRRHHDALHGRGRPPRAGAGRGGRALVNRRRVVYAWIA